MKRITLLVPSTPVLIGLIFALVLALVTGNFTSALISSAATQASPQTANPAVITGCVGNSNPGDFSLALSGRSITASTLLRVDPSGNCLTSETPITWNVQGPQGITGTQGIQGPKGDPTFTHTFVVTTTADAVDNGTRLLSVMTTISNSNPTFTNTNLVKLEPGIYELGSNSLTLPPSVELEGSGKAITRINSTAGSNNSLSTGTINLGYFTSVRELSVTNLGTSKYIAGVYSGYTSSFSSLTDIGIGTGSSCSTSCQNSMEVYGVYISNGKRVHIQNAYIETGFDGYAGGNSSATGIYNQGDLEIQDGIINSYSGANNYAIKSTPSSTATLIEQTTLRAVSGNLNYALYVEGPKTQVKNSSLTAPYGGNVPNYIAIYNNANGTTVQNSTLYAGTEGYLGNNPATQNAIVNLSTLFVGASQIDGGVSNTGTIKCVASYDGNYDPIANITACT